MLELLQFRFSPYNEKVRWALDVKRVPHRRTSLLPGPHMLRVKGLTGRTGTPVLCEGGAARDGSTALIEWLEERYPEPPLLPTRASDRAQALAIVRRFDDDIGPRARRAVLATLLRTPRYFASVFADGKAGWAQSAYALTVPLAAPLVRRGNGITGQASVDDGHRAFEEGLTLVATAGQGYLVGERFSVADLTAASMLAMCVDPPHSPMARPQPMAAPFAQLVQRYRDHPGAAWVRHIYAQHRGAQRDFDGLSA